MSDAAAWREEALAWVEAAIGGPPDGPVEERHAYPWAVALRVPTSEGDLWLKAIAPVHRFEAALLPELAQLAPGRVPEVVAADAGRGWLLLRDAGTPLRGIDSWPEQLGHWERALPQYAELQLGLAPHAAALERLGVPPERLATLPARFERLLADEDLLLAGEDALTADQLQRLRGSAGEVAGLCEELAGFGVPETLQHDDLHDAHVFAAGDGYRFLDWGDSCVSHPFHTLVVTLRFLAHRWALEPGGRELRRLRDAYLEPFGGAALAPAVDVAYRTGTIARALAWHRYVSHPEAAVEPDSADAVPYGLRVFLAGGPIGSWDPRDR